MSCLWSARLSHQVTAEYNHVAYTGTFNVLKNNTITYTLVYDIFENYEPAVIELPYTDLSDGSSKHFRVALQP